MIPVEQLVRTFLYGVENAYCAVFFACCRELKHITKYQPVDTPNEKPAETLADDTLIETEG